MIKLANGWGFEYQCSHLLMSEILGQVQFNFIVSVKPDPNVHRFSWESNSQLICTMATGNNTLYTYCEIKIKHIFYLVKNTHPKIGFTLK